MHLNVEMHSKCLIEAPKGVILTKNSIGIAIQVYLVVSTLFAFSDTFNRPKRLQTNESLCFVCEAVWSKSFQTLMASICCRCEPEIYGKITPT